MKSLIKPMLLGSSFTAIALFSSFSFAASDFNNTLFVNQGNATVFMFALPHSKSEGVQQNRMTEHHFVNTKPNTLLPKPSPESCMDSRKKKKNSLYELSAIFNDKLQMFLAYLSKPSKIQIAKQNNKKSPLNTPNINIEF